MVEIEMLLSTDGKERKREADIFFLYWEMGNQEKNREKIDLLSTSGF